jgi:carbon storage regulator
MRVLTRRVGQSVVVGSNVRVTVAAVRGDRVKLSVTAPQGLLVCRAEIIKELSEAAQEALTQTEVPFKPSPFELP